MVDWLVALKKKEVSDNYKEIKIIIRIKAVSNNFQRSEQVRGGHIGPV